MPSIKQAEYEELQRRSQELEALRNNQRAVRMELDTVKAEKRKADTDLQASEAKVRRLEGELETQTQRSRIQEELTDRYAQENEELQEELMIERSDANRYFHEARNIEAELTDRHAQENEELYNQLEELQEDLIIERSDANRFFHAARNTETALADTERPLNRFVGLLTDNPVVNNHVVNAVFNNPTINNIGNRIVGHVAEAVIDAAIAARPHHHAPALMAAPPALRVRGLRFIMSSVFGAGIIPTIFYTVTKKILGFVFPDRTKETIENASEAELVNLAEEATTEWADKIAHLEKCKTDCLDALLANTNLDTDTRYTVLVKHPKTPSSTLTELAKKLTDPEVLDGIYNHCNCQDTCELAIAQNKHVADETRGKFHMEEELNPKKSRCKIS